MKKMLIVLVVFVSLFLCSQAQAGNWGFNFGTNGFGVGYNNYHHGYYSDVNIGLTSPYYAPYYSPYYPAYNYSPYSFSFYGGNNHGYHSGYGHHNWNEGHGNWHRGAGRHR